MNSFIGPNFNNGRGWGGETAGVCVCVSEGGVGGLGGNTEKSGQKEKGECSWPRRALCNVTCERGRLQTPIHLPNFGQFNKLQEKLLWLCQGG